MPSPAKAKEGISRARLAYLRKTFSKWKAQERDCISEGNASFLPFEDKTNKQCHFVAEAGTAPVDLTSNSYMPGSGCVALLASSRLARANITYFIEIFRAKSGKQFADIISASPDGKLTAEKSLANEVNRADTITEVKTTKAALVNLIH